MQIPIYPPMLPGEGDTHFVAMIGQIKTPNRHPNYIYLALSLSIVYDTSVPCYSVQEPRYLTFMQSVTVTPFQPLLEGWWHSLCCPPLVPQLVLLGAQDGFLATSLTAPAPMRKSNACGVGLPCATAYQFHVGDAYHIPKNTRKGRSLYCIAQPPQGPAISLQQTAPPDAPDINRS